MGRKIFITYKYGDTGVYPLPGISNTRARDYVDALQKKLDKDDHINKGELDGQSLADFEDEVIASKLRDKIYDSSITIVLISKNMKNPYLTEKDQWMPWEISYSLKEHTRDGRTSLTNAMLAVVLPDEYNSYSYYITHNLACKSRTLHTPFLFGILKDNMFNIKNPDTRDCNGNVIFNGDASYVPSVTWKEFTKEINKHLDKAVEINNNIANYNIVKKVS
ncbi:MAG: TIR domain-containing protein [Sediminibacterium sp.]